MSIRHISYIYERRFLITDGSYTVVRTPSSSSGAMAVAAVVVSTAIVPTAAVISAKTEASRDSKDSP